ncbi:MAG TPA: AAA family ATPase [Chitinispirillaceae bacterium]|nr:AAA family ATPase [Chitinispirillaceae bacterium]
MQEIENRLELTAQQTELAIDFSRLEFDSTAELSALEEIIGQPRAVKALELGLGIKDIGYNIYLSGNSGMGKKALIQKMVSEIAANESTPEDWIYVNNIGQEDRPLSISLESGHGKKLKKEMEDLLNRLRDEVPRAFRQEDFSKEKQRLNMEYENQSKIAFSKMEQLASEKNLIIQEMPDGRILMIPKKGEHPMSAEEFDSLTDAEKEVISRNQTELGQLVSSAINQQREIGNKLRDEVRQIERNFASRLIDPAINEISSHYKSEKLGFWFSKVKEHMIDNLNNFREQDGSQQQSLASMLGGAPPTAEDFLQQYSINVVVDNSESRGAPVVFEESPNYKNLFGTIFGTFDRTGRLFTNFRNIKSGSLLRSNGGYLVFNLMEALTEPLVWKELKRTLKSGELEYHMYDPFGVFATSSLRPEPIPLKVKLLVVGNPLLYHLLQLYDEDFRELFKVKADFSPELDVKEDIETVMARFVQKLSKTDNVKPFSPHAVAELIKTGARFTGDKEKITSQFSRLADLARESSYWAHKSNAAVVQVEHVRTALEEKLYRSNLIAEQMREYIAKGTLIISISGSVIGQINGLSIIQLGDYEFGRPSRITVSVGTGAAGIINIERESRLSGSSYDKAMLILEGYLRSVYAQKHPLSLSASIAMEQSYGPVEGDSATIAELLCLLSAFARIPLRQDIAVTGSVNQMGQIQAVGGITQKVEGFYDTCKLMGLDGNQGVCIPASNIRNLVLRRELIDAIHDRRFHIWAVKNVNEALELLSGVPAGSIEEENSFHWKVDQRLKEMLELVKHHREIAAEREYPGYRNYPESSPDPRPRFPGDEGRS